MTVEIVNQFNVVKSIAVNAIAIDDSKSFLAVSQHNFKENSPTLSIINIIDGQIKIVEKTVGYFNGVSEICWLGTKLIYILENAPQKIQYKSFDLSTGSYEVLHNVSKPTVNPILKLKGKQIIFWDVDPFIYDFDKKAAFKKVELGAINKPVLFCSLASQTTFLCITANKEIAFLDLKTSKILYQKNIEFQRVLPYDKYILALGKNFAGVYIWNTETGVFLDAKPFNNPEQTFYSCSLDASEKIAALGGRIGHISIFEFQSGTVIYREKIHKSSVNTVCFSIDGSLMATGGTLGDIYLFKLG